MLAPIIFPGTIPTVSLCVPYPVDDEAAVVSRLEEALLERVSGKKSYIHGTLPFFLFFLKFKITMSSSTSSIDPSSFTRRAAQRDTLGARW